MSANANVQPNVPSQQPTPNIFNQRTENPTDMAGKKTIHSDVSAYVTQEIIENHRRDLNSSNSNRRIPVSLGDLQQHQQPIPLQDDDRHSVDSDSPDESACFIGADGDMMRRHHGYELEEAAQLEKLEIFAKEFKQKRIKMGFTQGDVGLAMGRLYGNDFSQTTISRFEALNLSFKNMCKLKPMLERWLRDTNTVLNEAKDGRPMIMPQIDTQFPSGRKRKKRTSIDQKKRSTLDVIFSRNPKPNSEDLHNIAEECSLDKEVVRVWFCNRRQKEKRIAMHEQQSNEGSMSSPDSPTHCHPQQTQPQQPSFHNNPAFTFQTNSSFSPMNPSREVPNQVTDRSKHLGMSPMGPNKGRHYAGQMLTQLGPEKKMIELPELHRNQQNQQNRAGAAQSRLTEDGVPASLAFPSPFFLSAAAAANARDVVKAVSAISMQQQHQQQQQQQQHQQPSFITSSSSSAEIPLTHSTISSCSSSFLPSSAPPQARYLCSSVSSMLPPPPTMPAVVPMTTGFQTTTGAAGIPLQLVHSNGVTSAASPVTQQRAASALHLK